MASRHYRQLTWLGRDEVADRFEATLRGQPHGYPIELFLMRPDATCDDDVRDAVLARAAETVALVHVNLAEVYDVCYAAVASVEPAPCVVTSRVAGAPLGQVVDRTRTVGGSRAAGFAAALATQLADGLCCVHDAGFAHGSVAASSIHVSASGLVRLHHLALPRTRRGLARQLRASHSRAALNESQYADARCFADLVTTIAVGIDLVGAPGSRRLLALARGAAPDHPQEFTGLDDAREAFAALAYELTSVAPTEALFELATIS